MRKNNMETKSSEKEKVARKKRNAKRKGLFDKNPKRLMETHMSVVDFNLCIFFIYSCCKPLTRCLYTANLFPVHKNV